MIFVFQNSFIYQNKPFFGKIATDFSKETLKSQLPTDKDIPYQDCYIVTEDKIKLHS